MPNKKPYRKQDKYYNEKQLARDFGSGLNDVIGRGTIAGLLGAPADIANLGENGIRGLLGLPQVTAWGGSEHIGQELEKAGLVSSVRRPKTELLASLISPSATAKTVLNAPKTARNMLKALDNLDAPNSFRRGLGNSQVGAIRVNHASPHEFDTFNAMDNIGAGEGAQAYGHGGYHSTGDLVHKNYLESVAPSQNRTAMQYRKMYGDRAADVLEAGITPNLTPEAVANQKQVIDLLRSGKRLEANSYTNELRWPDPAREAADPLSDKHFLDWDKPLSEQSQYIKDSLKLDDSSETGGDIYKYMRQSSGAQDDTSAYFNNRGVQGIRYLDGGSRSAGQGSHNYVTFDDALVNIMERNGKPVGLLGKRRKP